ncbi:hypothetical protein BJV77DRAFT_432246 [Russula vinacea]|nr:hypothetical protein BJV77DRAFT_432246 [Russula vinacea]
MREPKVAGSRLPGSTHDLITATISVELVLDAKACMSAAAQNQTPSWPSLYDPLLEFHDLEHHAPEQPGGHYLTHAGDVFRFTLYWMLIFFSLFFLTTGALPVSISSTRHDATTTTTTTRMGSLFGVLLDRKPCTRTSTRIAHSDPADALDVRAIA